MRKTKSIILLAVAMICIWAAGCWQNSLLAGRQKHWLAGPETLQNAPPIVVFTTVALGGFSGIMADILWLRASYLQEEGKYFELVQLADWITKLEPRCGDVWVFHAWNMAYNISVVMADPADRWRWVRNGVVLLRDEGLKHNPGDATIFSELAWLFQHKIGGFGDDTGLYYAIEWAKEMQDLFDGETPDYGRVSSDSAYAAELTEKWRLIPSIMKEVDEQYGPLDWRMPYTHAIYWAYRGSQRAARWEKLNCDRMIYQGEALSFFRGRLLIDQTNHTAAFLPNFDILPKALKTFDSMRRKYRRVEGVASAYSNFLFSAAVVLNQHGREESARQVFDLLRDRFPSHETDKGFEAFVAASKNDSERKYAPLKDAIPEEPK